MKKLVSLLLVLTLVLGLATAAFAEETAAVGTYENPEAVTEIPATAKVPVKAEGEQYGTYYFEVPVSFEGYKLTIESESMFLVMNNFGQPVGQAFPVYDEEDTTKIVGYSAEYVLQNVSMGMMPGAMAPTAILFGVANVGEEKITCTMSAEPPVAGSQYNPVTLELNKEYTVNALESEDYAYFMEYVAPVGGELTLNVSYMAASSDYADIDLVSRNQSAYNSLSEDPNFKTVTVPVATGETVEIYIDGYYEPCSATFTASFKEAPAGDWLNPIVVEDQDKDYDFTAKGSYSVSGDGGEEYFFTFYHLTDVEGAYLTVDSPDAVLVIPNSYGNPNWYEYINADSDADEDENVLTYQVMYQDEIVVGLAIIDFETNKFAETVTVNVSEPLGYDENAEVLDDITEFTVTVPGYDVPSYYVEWTADATGKYSFSIDKAVWNEDEDPYFITDEEGNPYPVNASLEVYVNGVGVEPTSANASVGDVITICVKEGKFKNDYGYEDGPYAADVTVVSTFDPLGSATNPIEISDPAQLGGIDVPAKGSVNYAINGKLNGQILTVKVDENATVTLNGKEVKAENGVVTAVLDNTPVNTLTVANKGDKAASYVAAINWPVGSESNPIVIESASDLTGLDVPAGASTYVAINSQLNGQILTINVDENAVVTLNGKEVKAENGVVTVALEGTPVNALVVTNKGEKDASYTASIAYALGTAGNPITVTTEKELNGTEIAAGEEVHYLLNSKLDGAVLSVKGDKAYVIVNGEKTEAKDGIIKLTLTAKGATISLVVGNAGEKAVTVTLGYSDNPNTGDAGVMAPIATALMSAMSTVALVIKKKEF